MRLLLVGALLLTAFLLVASLAGAEPRAANELGRVMILEYHRIDRPEGRWTRTPENFRRDLERLWAQGYRLVRLGDLLDGRVALPAGTSPVVLTFDDSSPGQFRYVEHGGTLAIDPDCAVGILETFARAHPEFGLAATFFVLPGANRPNRLFDQPAHAGRKLRYLVERGFELGNHTLWHANLGQYDEATVRAQLARAQAWIAREVPGYRLRALALPHGVYPREIEWAVAGALDGTTYRHEAILQVAGGAAPSPFARAWDPLRLPRIQALESELASWLDRFARRPGERFVSDGDPATVTVPPGRHAEVRGDLPGRLRVVERRDAERAARQPVPAGGARPSGR